MSNSKILELRENFKKTVDELNSYLAPGYGPKYDPFIGIVLNTTLDDSILILKNLCGNQYFSKEEQDELWILVQMFIEKVRTGRNLIDIALNDFEIDLIKSGKEIGAMSSLQRRTMCDLKKAKDFVFDYKIENKDLI